ncbi:MAG TPA: TylF/MycF/NovP-related O-methyltransferase, partial [bacterium]|nr:TylF/MycF/NovP-related O-methyltransferase [bacterium]
MANAKDNLKRYTRLRNLTATLETFIFGGYRMLAKHNIDAASHGVSISECTYSPWKINNEFNDLYEKIKNYTLVDKRKLYELWSLSRQLKFVRGHYIEIGVWRGGSGVLLGKTLMDHGAGEKIYLCDTYEGMPAITDQNDNFYKGGELADTSTEMVHQLAHDVGLNNVEILK